MPRRARSSRRSATSCARRSRPCSASPRSSRSGSRIASSRSSRATTARSRRRSSRCEDNLGVVVSEGERLTKLIDDVLDLAKIEAGKLEWHMEPVSAEDIIDRATAATSSLLRPQGPPPREGDRPGPADGQRRSRSPDPGRDQPDLERGQVHRHGHRSPAAPCRRTARSS